MKKLVVVAVAVGLSACVNMPTPSVQITGSYVSPLVYEQYECDRLVVEQASLARRQDQLVAAQEQRLRSSQVQAFWWGVGQGDGVEASELAVVRGQLEAVRTAMGNKQCEGATP